MDTDRFAELKADIQAHGLRQPIVLCDGLILDGRNRYRACVELGITPSTTTWDGDPFLYAWSLNGARRDLTSEQRGLIFLSVLDHSEAWAKQQKRLKDEANRKRSDAAKEQAKDQPRTQGGTFDRVVDKVCPAPGDNRPAPQHVSRIEKAKAAGVHPSTIANAEALRTARPDLAEKVAQGEMKAAEARRQIKREQVAEKAAAFPSSTYRVIYADPPWQYSDTRGGLADYEQSAAEAHYPTMSVSELCALDVRSLADPDAVLFCWATFPLLDDALEVVKAWGFTYKTAFVWDKQRANMGHYHTASAELLIVATRGSGVPDVDKREDQIQRIPRGKHSAKPEEFRDMIDRLYAHGRRIELFRRGDVPDGWEAWGNEVSRAS